MFRLLKLAAYSLIGYAIYEFFVGLLQTEDQKPQRSNASDSGRPAPLPRTEKTGITGPGEGVPVSTKAADGATASHRVGRGVVAS
jgi:hypothetical protein